MSPRLLTVREVATRLAVHPSTVYGLCDRGDLEHARVSNAIRIRADAVDAFLRSRSRVR
ncbi:MAG: helix-turn-helix domain-containing protein [Myxococcaceae bacterium]